MTAGSRYRVTAALPALTWASTHPAVTAVTARGPLTCAVTGNATRPAPEMRRCRHGRENPGGPLRPVRQAPRPDPHLRHLGHPQDASRAGPGWPRRPPSPAAPAASPAAWPTPAPSAPTSSSARRQRHGGRPPTASAPSGPKPPPGARPRSKPGGRRPPRQPQPSGGPPPTASARPPPTGPSAARPPPRCARATTVPASRTRSGQHDFRACTDAHCERPYCLTWKEAFRERIRSTATTRATRPGYDAGFPDGHRRLPAAARRG